MVSKTGLKFIRRDLIFLIIHLLMIQLHLVHTHFSLHQKLAGSSISSVWLMKKNERNVKIAPLFHSQNIAWECEKPRV